MREERDSWWHQDILTRPQKDLQKMKKRSKKARESWDLIVFEKREEKEKWRNNRLSDRKKKLKEGYKWFDCFFLIEKMIWNKFILFFF